MSATGFLQLLAVVWLIAGAAGEGFGGDDFANNLFSDLAPILSLFGERVTMQFMSQSMGWADNVILAMVPLGIITAVVSTIRVGGPTWLKALIGRAWESRAIVESDLMSSTSNEVCELWNGQQIVRVMGEGQVREFIILVGDPSDETAPGEAQPNTDILAPTAVRENMDAALVVGTELKGEGITNCATDGGEGSDHTPSAGTENTGVSDGTQDTSEDDEDSDGTQDTSDDTDDTDDNNSTQHASETTENSNSITSSDEQSEDSSNDTAANIEFMELRDDEKKEHLAEYASSAWDVILGRSSPHRKVLSTKFGIPAILRSRKRARATDIEKATQAGDPHITIEQPENQVSRSESSRRPVAVVRNTVVHTPNISLNIRNTSASRETYMVAVFGTLLQACLLVYAGLTATYLSGSNQLQENPPAAYAFPCMAAGTLMLVSGMLVCGRVVEGSTSERRYRPVDGKEARVVWLQRSGIVNDQSFESFAIFPTKAQTVITTSQRTRQVRNSTSQESSGGVTVEVATMVAAAITICGFVAQFVGLRGMNWTVSIAQLAAILLMAVLRSLVRRNLAERPNSQPLPLGHELDWLAMTLANPSNAPWLHPDKRGGDDTRRDKHTRPWTDHNGWDYRIIPVEKPNQTAFGGHIHARNSRAHQAMLIRRDLGALGKWRGPASAEATALARAIEIVMDTLVGPDRGTDILTWNLTSSSCGVHEPVTFRVARESRSRRSWKTSPAEIEAALSLWLYSVCHREKNEEETAYRSGSWLGGATRSQSKRAPGRSSLVILGSFDARILERDLGWWLPDNSFTKVLELSEKETRRTRNIGYAVDDTPTKVEAHRVVGFAQNAIDNPPMDIEVCLYRTKHQVGYVKQDIDGQSTLAVNSQSDLKTLYAQHTFSAFMWAVAAAIAGSQDVSEASVLGEAEIRTFLARSAEREHVSWDTDTFRNEKLSTLVRNIELTGLGSVDDTYFGILPPLSAWNLLPPVHAILKRGLELGHQFEQRRGWRGAGSTYVRLLKRTALFPRDNSTDIASEATALAMEFLKVLTETAKLWEDQLFDDMEIAELLRFKEWVKVRVAAYNDPAIFPRLMGLYERQGRAWKCDLAKGSATYPAIKPPEFGFHTLHQIACNNHFYVPDARETSYPKLKDLDTQDFLGWTAIHYAVACGSDNTFGSLLTLRANVNAQDIRRRTPLHYAYRHDDEQIVRELLRAGADINARDTDGTTPLHDAAKHGATKVAAALVEAGADINHTDNGGRTPLAWALYSGHGDFAREYLWDATNKKQRDRYGRTPLHLAAMSEGVTQDFGEMFGFLLPAIDKDVKDRGGYTPLHFAAAKGHLSATWWLLRQGANPYAKDDEYRRTPLSLAQLRLQKAKEDREDGTDDETEEEEWRWEPGTEDEWVNDSSEEGDDASIYKLQLGPDALKGLEDVIRVLKKLEQGNDHEGSDEERATEEGGVEERSDEGWETEEGIVLYYSLLKQRTV